MSFVSIVRKVSLNIFLLIILGGKALADGGTVQISKEEGPFRITVFTTSAIVRAGPEDISVLVQDRKSNQPLLDAKVQLSFRRLDAGPATQGGVWVPPCCRMKSSNSLDGMEATHQMATNKLLYAATAILPETGTWEVKTEVQATSGIATVTGQLSVEPPTPPMMAYWPFFFLPVVSIAGYVLHFNLQKRGIKRFNGQFSQLKLIN